VVVGPLKQIFVSTALNISNRRVCEETIRRHKAMASDTHSMSVLVQAALSASQSIGSNSEPASKAASRAAGSAWMPKEVKRLTKSVEYMMGEKMPEILSGATRDYEHIADSIDWAGISKLHVRTRDAGECRKKWIDQQKYPQCRVRIGSCRIGPH
jgi:hypothetical protein